MTVPYIVGLILARGGSKGIPKKNIVETAGKPLIAWTIEAACNSGVLDRVLVSTDDEQIAAVAREWGAEVPFLRPAELARDESPSVPAMIHAVDWLESHGGRAVDYVMLLQPTSPLRIPKDIIGAVEIMKKENAESVVSVCPARSHPYWTKRITEKGFLAEFADWPEKCHQRQSLPPAYALNGAIYLVSRDILYNRGVLTTENTRPYIMPIERSLDIDTPWDLRMADLILREQANAETKPRSI